MNKVYLALFALLVIVTVLRIAGIDRRIDGGTNVPVCPEDAVAVGTGEYTGGVGWSEYHCEALDNLS